MAEHGLQKQFRLSRNMLLDLTSSIMAQNIFRRKKQGIDRIFFEWEKVFSN